MGQKVYSELAIKNAIRILAKAVANGQMTEKEIDAVFVALGCKVDSTPEDCAQWARTWAPTFLRRFLECITFSRGGYHTTEDIIRAVKERLAA